jgi:formate hydrogenlyase subunit 4
MTEKVYTILIMIISFFTLPLITRGIIRKIRARAQGRKGPPLFQNINDIMRLIQKSPIDGIFSGVFCEVAPTFAVFSSVMIWSIVVFEWSYFIMIPFFIAMQRISITGYAMETGTSFGGLGTSREILLFIATEPIIIILILLAQSKMSMVFSWVGFILGFLFLSVSTVAILAELARPPFDDPRTHLELTMVHEAMLLEASGRSMAFFEIAYQIKIASFMVFISKLALEHSKDIYGLVIPSYITGLLAFSGAIGLAAIIGYWESISSRRKWTWVPETIGLTFLFLIVFATLVKLI